MGGEVFQTETWTLQDLEVRVLQRQQAGRLDGATGVAGGVWRMGS